MLNHLGDLFMIYKGFFLTKSKKRKRKKKKRLETFIYKYKWGKK